MNPESVRERIAAPHPDRSTLPPAAQLPDGTRLLRGVPYAEVEGGRPLELDLWLPAPDTSGPVPLVLYVHGGAWRRGRRDDPGPRIRGWEPGPFARIATTGLAVACVDYRLSGEAVFPAQLDDLRAALRWLASRGPELGVDAERAVVWGESAGGHLASLLALTSAPAWFAGAVVWYGPADLITARGPFDPADPTTPEAALLGAPPVRVPERAARAGPLAQVHGAAPPFLLLHGTHDTMVDPSHSEDLAAQLQRTGVQVELGMIDGAEHGWLGVPEGDVEDLFVRSLAFVSDCLKPGRNASGDPARNASGEPGRSLFREP